MIKSGVEKAKIVDILKIHDYHYVKKVMQHIQNLNYTDNKILEFFDGADTAISE